MPNKGSYKQGGSGKSSRIPGHNQKGFSKGYENIKDKPRKTCVICKAFKGINILEIVKCSEKNHKGLEICSNFEEK